MSTEAMRTIYFEVKASTVTSNEWYNPVEEVSAIKLALHLKRKGMKVTIRKFLAEDITHKLENL